MKFGRIGAAEAEGAILAHSLRLDAGVFKKGRVLSSDDVAALVEAGFTRLVSAGGETSGAVVTGLDVQSLEIGPEIDPGVPAVRVEGRELALALKSGNFGADDFFAKAASRLGGEA